MRTHVAVDQHFDVVAQGRSAGSAYLMLELEIPFAPTARTPVVGHDLDLAIGDVSVRRGIAPGAVGLSLVRNGEAGCKQRHPSLFLPVKDVYGYVQTDRISFAERSTQCRQGLLQVRRGILFEQRVNNFCQGVELLVRFFE